MQDPTTKPRRQRARSATPKPWVDLESLPEAEVTSADSHVVVFRSQLIKNRRIRLSAPWSVIGGEWKKCEFLITAATVSAKKDAVGFRDAAFNECTFVSESDECRGAITFNECDLNDSEITGALHTVKMVNMRVPVYFCRFGLHADTFEAEDATFEHCRFTGSFRNWLTSDAMFVACYWAPEIYVKADLRRARFDGSVITIGSWTDVCTSKDQVYLQTADKIIDEWAELRTEYTGVRLYIILMLTLAFIMPYAIKAWVLSLAAGALRSAPFEVDWVPLWHALVFPAGSAKLVPAILAALLLFYNAGRLWLTFRVAAMREREEHLIATGFTATRPTFRSVRRTLLRWPKPLNIEFTPLLLLHRTLRLLFFVSLVSATLRLSIFLLSPVPTFR